MAETVLYNGGIKCVACNRIVWIRYDIENHHFPVSKNHSGSKTIPLCVECHSLVERISFMEWPIEISQCIFDENMPRPLKLLFLKFWKLNENKEMG